MQGQALQLHQEDRSEYATNARPKTKLPNEPPKAQGKREVRTSIFEWSALSLIWLKAQKQTEKSGKRTHLAFSKQVHLSLRESERKNVKSAKLLLPQRITRTIISHSPLVTFAAQIYEKKNQFLSHKQEKQW